MFTAIIPAYNPGELIEEALQSVADQFERPEWVVVIDDGSEDGTYERATTLLRHHALAGVVLRQTNRGISAARNAGLAERRTDWIALLDADDLWLPGHLKQLRLAISECPDAVVAFGDSRYFGDARSRTDLLARERTLGLSTGSSNDGIHILSTGIFDALLPGLFIPVSASAIRMNCGDPEPRFDVGLASGEDRYFFLQMSRRGSFVFSDRQGARTRRHAHNTTHHFNAVKLNDNLLTLLEKIGDSTEFQLDAAQRAIVAKAKADAARVLLYCASCEGCFALGRAWQHAAPSVRPARLPAMKDIARALAVSLGVKKAGQPDKPMKPEK